MEKMDEYRCTEGNLITHGAEYLRPQQPYTISMSPCHETPTLMLCRVGEKHLQEETSCIQERDLLRTLEETSEDNRAMETVIPEGALRKAQHQLLR